MRPVPGNEARPVLNTRTPPAFRVQILFVRQRRYLWTVGSGAAL